MALATRCPHCNTTFRVAADQLKLRGGIVRCGSCNQIFDGNSALVDLNNPPELPVAPEIDSKAAEEQYEPVLSVDFDIFDPDLKTAEPIDVIDVIDEHGPDSAFVVDQETQPEAAVPEEPAAEEPAAEEPAAEEPVPEEPAPEEPAAPPDLEHGPLPLLRQSSPSEQAPAEAEPVVPKYKQKKTKARTRVESAAEPLPEPPPPPPPDPDEPEFVRQSRAQEATLARRRLILLAASALLAILLLVQAATTFRNVLVARYPALGGPVGAVCAVFGCRIELPMQIDTLSIETGELQSLGENSFGLTTLLRNQSTLVQAWPSIELELTDANDKPLLRRVFGPADYLPRGSATARGFPARSEQAVKLQFEVSQIKASGYHIAIFYP